MILVDQPSTKNDSILSHTFKKKPSQRNSNIKLKNTLQPNPPILNLLFSNNIPSLLLHIPIFRSPNLARQPVPKTRLSGVHQEQLVHHGQAAGTCEARSSAGGLGGLRKGKAKEKHLGTIGKMFLNSGCINYACFLEKEMGKGLFGRCFVFLKVLGVLRALKQESVIEKYWIC